MGASWPVLGASWAVLGPSWGVLGPSWGPLGPSGGSLGGLVGRLGAVLETSWAVLERREAEKARRPKTSKNTMEIDDFCRSGPSWEASREASGGVLEASGAVLGQSRASWAHLWACRGSPRPIFRRARALRSRLGSLLGPSWRVLEPPWAARGGTGPARGGFESSEPAPFWHARVPALEYRLGWTRACCPWRR